MYRFKDIIIFVWVRLRVIRYTVTLNIQLSLIYARNLIKHRKKASHAVVKIAIIKVIECSIFVISVLTFDNYYNEYLHIHLDLRIHFWPHL